MLLSYMIGLNSLSSQITQTQNSSLQGLQKSPGKVYSQEEVASYQGRESLTQGNLQIANRLTRSQTTQCINSVPRQLTAEEVSEIRSAIYTNNFERIKQLVKPNVDIVNVPEEQPIMLIAARDGTAEIFKYIYQIHKMQNGAVDITNNYGQTALHRAIHNGKRGVGPYIIDFLCKNGANINSKDSSGNTPLHLSIEFIGSSTSDLQKLKALLENGANMHVSDNNNETPLQLSRRSSDYMRRITNWILRAHEKGFPVTLEGLIRTRDEGELAVRRELVEHLREVYNNDLEWIPALQRQYKTAISA